MSRMSTRHADGSVETWDDSTCLYVRKNSAGAQVESRTLTDEERTMLDPRAAEITALQAIVDQLILDSLMGGLF